MRLQKKSAVLRSDNCYIEVSWYSGLYSERWCNSKSYTTPNRTRSIVKTILELHLKKIPPFFLKMESLSYRKK